MILLRLLSSIWKTLSAPPPARLPGPGVLPAYVRMERFASGAALEPRVDLLVRQLAAELAGCRWCIEHGVHRWRGSFLPVAELGALRRHAASPLFSPRERAALAFTEADALRRGGGRHSGIRAGRAAVPLFRAASRRPHAGRSGRALLQCCNRCPRRRRAARAGRHGRRVPAGKAARRGLRCAEPVVTGRRARSRPLGKRRAPETPGGRWLLLIHQLPPKPDYFRVKVWRRLQRIGAVAIKNSVYVLPHTEQASEDFQWLRREIVAGGGEASVCQAAFVDGLSDGQIEALFRAQRDAE